MIDSSKSLVGVGLYSVPEAARLSHVSSQRIRRWIRGYRRGSNPGSRQYASIWRPDLPYIEGIVALSFRDLMEVRFVNAFRVHGVSWKIIRLAAQKAMEFLETDHPFSSRTFRTDGKRIFADFTEVSGHRKLLDLVRDQFAFPKIVEPSLYEGLEFSEGDEIVRWWPMGPNKRIILDPERSFGQPIDNESGVQAQILADAYSAEHSVERVAILFDVDERAVNDAIEFEEELAA
ncbi:MAG: helix-turn-helix domain-containing protein [Proteobacteria bacterium]|nr:helix-turn-helix domain-containing protein [Pseudomonadota bacterium]